MSHAGAAANFPSIGRWTVTAFPRGWIYIDEFGIRQMTMDPKEVPANVGLGQDTLSDELALGEYIEKQKKMIEGHLLEARFSGPQPTTFAGADEAHLLLIRHSVASVGGMLHVQTYVRRGLWLGIVTLTSIESLVRTVKPDYDAFVRGLHILPEPPSGAVPQAGSADADPGGR